MSEFDPIRPVGSKFRLGRGSKKIFGVCSGIADYFGWDVTLVRIAFAVGAVFGVGSFVVLYLAIALIAD